MIRRSIMPDVRPPLTLISAGPSMRNGSAIAGLGAEGGIDIAAQLNPEAPSQH
jgi:hypothetical protein